jgi:hypothetical protein
MHSLGGNDDALEAGGSEQRSNKALAGHPTIKKANRNVVPSIIFISNKFELSFVTVNYFQNSTM